MKLVPISCSSVIRVQMVQMFSHCVLGSPDDMDLDELLATKLVTFMMEHHSAIFQVNAKLRCQVEEHLSHLKRAQVSHVQTERKHETEVVSQLQLTGFCFFFPIKYL